MSHRLCTNPVGCSLQRLALQVLKGEHPPIFVMHTMTDTTAVQSNKVEGRRKSFLGVFGLTPRRNSNATSAFSGGRTSRPQTPPAHP